jgi:phage-related protein (TIGR01555 family)
MNVINFRRVQDSFTNFVSGLMTPKDRVTWSQPTIELLSFAELDMLYRGDWICRKIIDLPAFDSTREWRAWHADPTQIEDIEAVEKAMGLQRKIRRAMTQARLYGGAAIIFGISGQRFTDPLDLDAVKKDDLKFIHVLSRHQLAAGAIIRDVTSPWYGEPSYYLRSNVPTPPAPVEIDVSGDLSGLPPGAGDQQLYIHPSRVVRLTGNDYPDIDSAPDGWGDSVLQSVYSAIRASDLVVSSAAHMMSEAKIDVIRIPGLTETLATNSGTNKLIGRFTNANTAKSVVNALLLDKTEEWDRKQLELSGIPKVLEQFLLICSGAADIPATRMLGRAPAGMDATGESDTRNYYDKLSSEQAETLKPALNRLDEVVIRSALGSRPDEVDYEWNPLWQMDEDTSSKVAYQKAQAHKIDVDNGLINPEVLREARINQLIEDGFYPGIEQAIEEFGSEPDEEDILESAMKKARVGMGGDPNVDPNAPKPGEGSPASEGDPRTAGKP